MLIQQGSLSKRKGMLDAKLKPEITPKSLLQQASHKQYRENVQEGKKSSTVR